MPYLGMHYQNIVIPDNSILVQNPSIGDLIYHDSNNWTVLHPGTSGNLLLSGTTPSWGTLAVNNSGSIDQALRDQMALSNMRLLLNSNVNSGYLVDGYQFELLTDEFSGASSGYTFNAGNPGYYESNSVIMTLITPIVSSTLPPDVINVYFLYKDDSAVAVLGTDITVEVSRDSGTTYSTAALTVLANYDSTYKLIKATGTVTSNPSGTSMVARIKTWNSKPQRIGTPAIYCTVPIVNIDHPPSWVSTAGNLGSFDQGTYLNIQFSATDADSDILSYYIISGSLPNGTNLSSSGLLSGPTYGTGAHIPGPFIFTVRADDSKGGITDRTFSINITAPGVVQPYAMADTGVLFGGAGTCATGTFTSLITTMQYVTISTPGTSIFMGNLTLPRASQNGSKCATSNGNGGIGIIAGGLFNSASKLTNIIDYMNFGGGDAAVFGSLPYSKEPAAVANGTNNRAIFCSGTTSTGIATSEYVTITTLSNAVSFGTFSTIGGGTGLAACSNGSLNRGIISGGTSNTQNVQFITISTLSNSVSWGSLSALTGYHGSLSNDHDNRALFAGGPIGSAVNGIEYMNISVPSNAATFGHMTVRRQSPSGVSNGINNIGIFFGTIGTTSYGGCNNGEYRNISTLGNTVIFGTLSTACNFNVGAASNSAL